MAEKIASIYAEIGADTKGLKKGLTETKSGLTGAAAELGKFKASSLATWGAIGGVVTSAGIAIKKMMDKTVAYTKEVRDMTYFTGASSDEISRMVQVADDWGISIEQVRTSMRYLTKNGIEPSIDALANLADEYVASADKTEFAAKAAKLLGREWTTLIPLFAKGGDALRKQAAAVDKNLIVTEEMIATAREYELAMDAWQEQSEKLVYHWGSALLPKGAAVLKLMTDLTSLDAAGWFEDGADASADFINKFIYGKTVVEDFNVAASKFQKEDMIGGLEGISEAADEVLPRLSNTSGQFYALSAAIRKGAQSAEEAEGPIKNFLDEVDRNVDSPIADFIGDLRWLQAGGYNINLKFEEIMQAVKDKKITPAEGEQMLEGLYAAAIDLQTDLDMIDAETAAENISTTLGVSLDQAKAMINGTDGITGAMAALTSQPWYVDIYYREHNKPTPSGATVDENGNPIPRAVGGPVVGGGLYLVGEHGPELFVPNISGQIIPNDKSIDSAGSPLSSGDVYVVQNFYDQGAAALGMAYVETLRGQRLDASMGR
jgi:hypothetical protein